MIRYDTIFLNRIFDYCILLENRILSAYLFSGLPAAGKVITGKDSFFIKLYV